jgi:hypothetical protein
MRLIRSRHTASHWSNNWWAAHRVERAAHQSLAALTTLANQARPFEHGGVLLHGGEGQRVAPSQGVTDSSAAKMTDTMSRRVTSARP